MKRWTAPLAVLTAIGFAASVNAQCPRPKRGSDDARSASAAKTGSCCAKGGTKSCCATPKTATCRGTKLVATGMPLMTYKVGDETTTCPKQARELAGKNGNAEMRYVVAGTEYTCKTSALAAYQTVLANYLNDMTAVRYAVGGECVSCPMAAKSLARKGGQPIKFQVASFTFDDRSKADKAAEAARDAIQSVNWTMTVDGKQYTCEKSARAACKGKAGAGSKVCRYKIGDCDTTCRTTAEVELTKARIQAAYDAVEQVANGKIARQ